MIPTVKYHHPVKVPWPLHSAQSPLPDFAQASQHGILEAEHHANAVSLRPPDRTLKLVDSILIR